MTDLTIECFICHKALRVDVHDFVQVEGRTVCLHHKGVRENIMLEDVHTASFAKKGKW